MQSFLNALHWVLNNWQAILLGALAIETGFARAFPGVGFLKTAETELEAVASATGVKPPQS